MWVVLAENFKNEVAVRRSTRHRVNLVSPGNEVVYKYARDEGGPSLATLIGVRPTAEYNKPAGALFCFLENGGCWSVNYIWRGLLYWLIGFFSVESAVTKNSRVKMEMDEWSNCKKSESKWMIQFLFSYFGFLLFSILCVIRRGDDASEIDATTWWSLILNE